MRHHCSVRIPVLSIWLRIAIGQGTRLAELKATVHVIMKEFLFDPLCT